MSRTPLIHPAPVLPPVAVHGYVDDDVEPRPARRRRRVLMAVAYLLLAVAVLLIGSYVRAGERDPLVVPPATMPSIEGRHSSTKPPSPQVTKAAGTGGTFAYVPGSGPMLGSAGRVRRFHVAVESPAGTGAPQAFAAEVDRTLGDKRSWTAGRRFRLQRVAPSTPAEFTIYLASARTSEKMCRIGGLETGAYSSCRLPGKVIVNDDRWEGAVRGYGASLDTYRAYAINHEVGHQLGHGHEACPGKGRPAPVMMQQTFGLKGCVANSWPYVNGKRYSGPPAR